ncbi:MAG: SgcJ/EcaC family oxidoreductase [Candidatus Acidiferrales bacterium]
MTIPRLSMRVLSNVLIGISCSLLPSFAFAQDSLAKDEIPIERCDRLPVVKVHVTGKDMHFLLDTAASTMLNIKSFSGGRSLEEHIASWNGTAATSAREVSVAELTLGKHTLHDLKLPAIDLSPIGAACHGPIDGILGMDLLDKMGVTIDLKRRVASMGADPVDVRATYEAMENSMEPCMVAFDKGDAAEFGKCLDPDVVMYTPHGEFIGRKQVIDYMQERFFKYAPNAQYITKLRNAQMFGDALWYSYDYTLDTPVEHRTGHGMAMCRKSDGRWRVLNMHNSSVETGRSAAVSPSGRSGAAKP